MIRKKPFLLFVLTLFSAAGLCHVTPRDNSLVNYSHVYFEEDLYAKAKEYELIIYKDTPGNIHLSVKNKLPAFFVPALEWGATYFWKIKAYDQDRKELYGGRIHKFSIQNIASSDGELTRLAVKTNKENRHAKGLIAVDYTKSIFDRSGRPVWTIPHIDTILTDKTQVRDLKVTKDNSVTFLASNIPVEIDFDGGILWKAPYPFIFQSDTIFYHHDFKKTNRGTYMVLGLRKVYRRVLGTYPQEHLTKEGSPLKMIGDTTYKRTLITLLFEFGRDGKLIWYWDANEYITDEDLNYKLTPAGLPLFGTHANAFSENEEGTKVYIGFRDLSRIVKVDKKTKKAEASYGEKFPSGDGQLARSLFRKQHDASVTAHNSILIFNNGDKNERVSSVMELKDNATKKDSVLLWKFDLDFDTLTDGKGLSGGNVVELPNSNLLVCAGVLNRVFEVTKKKEVVWDAFVESKRKTDTLWHAFQQYRCNWVRQINRYHFIPQVLSAEIPGKNFKGFSILINNTGNADDAYDIEVLSEKEAPLYKTKTKTIRQNETGSQDLNFKLSDPGIKTLKVLIRSRNSFLINSLVINVV